MIKLSRKLQLVCASALFLTPLGCSQADTGPSQFTTAQKEELGEFVRDYLVENPEVIIEALTVLEERRLAEEAEAKRAALPLLLEQKGAPIIGNPDAPITIVEFFDYNCSFCKRATDWVLEQVDHKDQNVRVIFMDLPVLDARTKTSAMAARAALAAEKQGKYREMHVALMRSNGLSRARVRELAEEVGLDVQLLEKDMESAAIYRHVDDIMTLADAAGIEATPGFFINGEFVSGYNPPLLKTLMKDARATVK